MTISIDIKTVNIMTVVLTLLLNLIGQVLPAGFAR